MFSLYLFNNLFVQIRVNDSSDSENPQMFYYNAYADMNQQDYGVMFAYKHNHFRYVQIGLHPGLTMSICSQITSVYMSSTTCIFITLMGCLPVVLLVSLFNF